MAGFDTILYSCLVEKRVRSCHFFSFRDLYVRQRFVITFSHRNRSRLFWDWCSHSKTDEVRFMCAAVQLGYTSWVTDSYRKWNRLGHKRTFIDVVNLLFCLEILCRAWIEWFIAYFIIDPHYKVEMMKCFAWQ